MSKHTPGPWRVDRQNPSPTTGEWMISGSKPGYLAEVRDCGSGDVKSNARLIAAAPEMLEVLQLCRQHMYDHASNTPDNAFEKLCAVIAKATGETK